MHEELQEWEFRESTSRHSRIEEFSIRVRRRVWKILLSSFSGRRVRDGRESQIHKRERHYGSTPSALNRSQLRGLLRVGRSLTPCQNIRSFDFRTSREKKNIVTWYLDERETARYANARFYVFAITFLEALSVLKRHQRVISKSKVNLISLYPPNILIFISAFWISQNFNLFKKRKKFLFRQANIMLPRNICNMYNRYCATKKSEIEENGLKTKD